MQPEDLSDEVYDSIERFFDENFSEIRSAVKEDIQDGWGSLPNGPFNTDPLIEPRLKVLSERPKYAIAHSEIENQRLHLFVSFWCDATIRCKKYRNKGDEFPLRTKTVSNLVTYEIPVNLTIDLETNEIEDFELGDLAWEKMEWSENQVPVDLAKREEHWDIDEMLQAPSSLSDDLLDKIKAIFEVVSPYLGMPLELFERQFLRPACAEKALDLWCRIIAAWHAYHVKYLGTTKLSQEQERAIIKALITVSTGETEISSLGVEEDVAALLMECFRDIPQK